MLDTNVTKVDKNPLFRSMLHRKKKGETAQDAAEKDATLRNDLEVFANFVFNQAWSERESIVGAVQEPTYNWVRKRLAALDALYALPARD